MLRTGTLTSFRETTPGLCIRWGRWGPVLSTARTRGDVQPRRRVGEPWMEGGFLLKLDQQSKDRAQGQGLVKQRTWRGLTEVWLRSECSSPEPGGLKQQKINSQAVLESGSLKSSCPQGLAPCADLGKRRSLFSSSFWHSLPLHGLFLASLSMSSYKDTH